ncbi:MAG: phosphate acetyltransferase [Candidatus Cloacimonetes bacterium]|jgi:phosphate acetyltransferase|nr:phosphate acetyltransferase [Candidatus Cloacimonadota bacterium]MDD2506194.1 phosphate acetyltransferase [Candidatus Cloacimonadota bacterium]MDD4147572.1 phosphate acetyltransferase [Candidatus Cloacimonadota bacterium]MDD4559364.1 phosphate acetyltransferase [Candidatus Cloacimonadota bacterium]
MHILETLKRRATAIGGSIVLPESHDQRTLAAAASLAGQKIARVILLGEPAEVTNNAAQLGADISSCTIINPVKSTELEDFAETFHQRRKEKGVSKEQALETMKNPLYFGAMMVKKGLAGGMVAGAANTTADVLRAALQVVGVMPGLKTVSSTFIMVSPRAGDPTYLFADCAVVPNPDSEQLADIANSTAITRRSILGDEPFVALLSFSTKGSADHELAEKVRVAKSILDARKVDFAYDGELQLDAAIVPKIAKSKAPDSSVAGHANTLVFPDLQAGNIGYKLVQRLGGYEAIGPIIQGLAAPICDLSRGCSAEDIVNTAILVLLMAKNLK